MAPYGVKNAIFSKNSFNNIGEKHIIRFMDLSVVFLLKLFNSKSMFTIKIDFYSLEKLLKKA